MQLCMTKISSMSRRREPLNRVMVRQEKRALEYHLCFHFAAVNPFSSVFCRQIAAVCYFFEDSFDENFAAVLFLICNTLQWIIYHLAALLVELLDHLRKQINQI